MQHSVFRFGLIGWLYLCLAGRMLSAFPLIPTKFPDDATLWREFADALGKKYQEGKTPKLRDLYTQLERTNRASIHLKKFTSVEKKAEDIFKTCSKSVVALGSAYKCNHCPHWHTGTTATGWVIGSRGEIVSNYHVLADKRNTNVVAVGVMTQDGRCFPIQEVLVADRTRDVVIVRIDDHDLPALAIAPPEPVGRPISIISHPNGELFTFTQGTISRYASRAVEPSSPTIGWMFVTADFAIGSSGGPVINRCGEVVGMVARTATLSADPANPGLTTQMVVKMTIPAEGILNLVSSESLNQPKRLSRGISGGK